MKVKLSFTNVQRASIRGPSTIDVSVFVFYFPPFHLLF
jgi:hypothetical protein